MTPQERDVIAGIFDRLRQVADQPRDPEADRFIQEQLRAQPYAAYAMAQSIYVQEQALTNLQSQVEQLQAEVQRLRSQPPQPTREEAGQQGGGIFGGLFGGSQPARPRSVPAFPQRAAAPEQGASPAWGSQSQAAPGPGPAQNAVPGQQPASGPWQNQAGQPQAPARGGFLAGALTTAAGVAGGMMLGNVLMNAFKGESGEKPAETAKADETGTQNDAANAQPAADTQDYAEPQADYHDAGYQDGGFDDGFDGGDWA